MLDPSGALVGRRLVVGYGERTARRTVELDPESFAAGPFGSVFLVGTDDGTRSRVRALDIVAGCATTLAETVDIIRRATMAPDGSAIAEHRIDRRTRQDLGIWRRTIDGFPSTDLLLPPIERDERFGRTWSTEFIRDAAGDELAVQTCGETACRIRVVGWRQTEDPSRRATLEAGLVAEPDLGPAVGLADGVIVAYLACPGLPCPIVAMDVSGAARRTLAAEAGPATVVDSAAGSRLVVEDLSGGVPTLRSVTLDGRISQDLGSLPAGLDLLVDATRADSGQTVPEGWVLLAPDGRLPSDPTAPEPMLRHVLDGRTVTVDEVIP